MTFVELDIGFTAWEDYEVELGFSVDLLNGAAATNYAGMAIGCIFLVPLVNKYGRRPMYLFSTALQLASVIWFAKTETRGDLIGSNLISGLGGAISETIVQMTIADLFFVHHHAAMNAYYMLATSIGAFLGPVASGYVVVSQGWRWMFWWCTIFFAVNLVALIFLFEETKYVSVLVGHNGAETRPVQGNPRDDTVDQPNPGDSKPTELGSPVEPTRLDSHLHVDHTIRMKTLWERLPLITKTDGSILHDIYQPVVLLFTFPAIAYTAMTYGSLLAWFATMTSVQATYLFYPPYNFSAAGVGLMNVAPFVGVIPGTFVGGYLNDKSILWLSKRNNGIYEPEMRLWLALLGAIVTPAGILLFGVGLAHVRDVLRWFPSL